MEANNTRVLVDCGLVQERKLISRNWEPFQFSPGSLDALLLTHAHVDHCGLIPKLVRDGFRGKIYCTEATADIARIILLDAAHLQEEDAEKKKRRHQREGRKGPYPEAPLYTIADAEASLPFFAPVKYDEAVDVGDGITATFRDAGHVLGSSMIKVVVSQDGESRSLVFSGDVGRWDRPMLEDPHDFGVSDYVIVESTYGDRVHDEQPDICDRLEEILNSAVRAGGNVIVPSFALQRSQEILYHMNELLLNKRIPQRPVFLDSPMAVRITEVFKRHAELFDKEMSRLMHQHKSPFEFPGLKLVQTVEESKAINDVTGSMMVIAGSGMCNGGRIKHHLINNITSPENTILFVGYQAVGTLGRIITEGAKEVRIFGQKYSVRANIAQIHGLSAHADKEELFRWLDDFDNVPRRIFVTHGEAEAAEKFGAFLREKKEWEVTVPDYGEEITLG
ncbi:MBL fold metallo-hydrolase RNA specificity domain-containing protein [Chloroflexota bacterium]